MKNIFFAITLSLFAAAVCKSQSIVSISPSSVAAGQTLNVTIVGTGTHFTAASGTTVQFGFEQCSGTVVNSLFVNSNTQITANISVAAPNLYNNLHDVEVYDPTDGYLVKDHIFAVTNASAFPVTLTPNSGIAGQVLNVTITGTGTHFMQGSSSGVKIEFDFDQRVCVASHNYFFASPSSNTVMDFLCVIPMGTDTGYYDFSIHDGVDNFGTFQNIFHVTRPVSVNELESEYHLEVAPNPFSNFTSLDYALSSSEAVLIELYDLFGRKVFVKSTGKQTPGSHSIRIDAEELNLSTGIYYLRFSVGDRNVTKRILLSR